MNAAARMLNQGTLSRTWLVAAFFTRSQMFTFSLIVALMVTSLSVVYVTNAVRGLHAGLQQLAVERDQLHIAWGQLLLEQSTWAMQGRIQDIATQKLGMEIPDTKAVVVV